MKKHTQGLHGREAMRPGFEPGYEYRAHPCDWFLHGGAAQDGAPWGWARRGRGWRVELRATISKQGGGSGAAEGAEDRR